MQEGRTTGQITGKETDTARQAQDKRSLQGTRQAVHWETLSRPQPCKQNNGLCKRPFDELGQTSLC